MLVYYLTKDSGHAGLLPNKGFRLCWYTTLTKDSVMQVYSLNKGFRSCRFTTLTKDSGHAGLLP